MTNETSVPAGKNLPISDRIRQWAASSGVTLEDTKDVWVIRKPVAERKAFLSRRKLEYIAKLRILEAEKEVRFTEMLKESGWGLGGIEAGAGFKVETYNTSLKKPREGGIAEQSALFGKKYTYAFKWEDIRSALEKLAAESGYTFTYAITPLGL